MNSEGEAEARGETGEDRESRGGGYRGMAPRDPSSPVEVAAAREETHRACMYGPELGFFSCESLMSLRAEPTGVEIGREVDGVGEYKAKGTWISTA